MKANHDVKLDHVGISLPERERLTCYSEGCGGVTLVRNPGESASKFEERAAEFLKRHPTTQVRLRKS